MPGWLDCTHVLRRKKHSFRATTLETPAVTWEAWDTATDPRSKKQWLIRRDPEGRLRGEYEACDHATLRVHPDVPAHLHEIGIDPRAADAAFWDRLPPNTGCVVLSPLQRAAIEAIAQLEEGLDLGPHLDGGLTAALAAEAVGEMQPHPTVSITKLTADDEDPPPGWCSYATQAVVSVLSHVRRVVPRGGQAVTVDSIGCSARTIRLRVRGHQSKAGTIRRIARCLGTLLVAGYPQPRTVPDTAELLHDWATAHGVNYPLAAIDRNVWNTLESDRKSLSAGAAGDLKARWMKVKIRGASLVHAIWTERNGLKPQNLVRHRA